MRLPIYVADAFCDRPFSGNPAAVVPLDYWLETETMQAIAEQHNLSETAFVVMHPDEHRNRPLRWFTPAREVRLCGHATLATAFVLGDVLQVPGDEFGFTTLSGPLHCNKTEDGWKLDLPADVAELSPDFVAQAEAVVGSSPMAVLEGKDDLLIILDSAEAVHSLVPDGNAIRATGKRGVVVSARGDEGYDVVSRCFYPEFGIDEDAVTGSAHTLIGPYWSSRLGKAQLRCRQASRRGGDVAVHYAGGERISLGGGTRLYMHGEIKV